MRVGSADALITVRGHPRHLVLAGAVAGLLAGPLLGAGPLVVLAAAGAFAVLAGRPVVALAAAAAVVVGALGAVDRLAALDRTELAPMLGRSVSVRGVLLEQPRAGRFARSAQARLLTGPGRGERVVLRARLRVAWPASPTGSILDLRGKLERLGPYDDYQRRRGAHAVLLTDRLSPTGRARQGVWAVIDRIRGRAETGLTAGLPPPQAALLRGMVLGQDEQLAAPVRQDFRRSGLAHVLAASGQNVLLLAALALPLLALAGLGHRGRLAGVLALIALYVPLAGAGPPIQRAGVMGAAGVVAGLAGRPASRWYALLLAAAVTLAVNPRSAADVGWQLSFAAVIAIIAITPRCRGWLLRQRVPSALAEAAALTFAATLGTMPLLAFHFARVSLVSLPANLIATPAIAPLMWLGMLAAAAGQVTPAAAALVNGLNIYPLAFVQWLAHAAASLPHASVPLALASPLALAGAYAALGVLVVVPRARGPGVAIAAVLVSLLVLRAPPGLPAPPAGPLVSFLSVGQGDATLVQDGRAAMLIDTGPPDGPILARLRSAGVRRLDVLVVTHAQADHEGGAAAVIAHYPVSLLLDGGEGAPTAEHRALVAMAIRRRVHRIAPDAGQLVRAGALTLRIYWPHREPAAEHRGEDPNARAIVAELAVGRFRLLFPADAESDVTAGLDLPPVDAIKVAHHGSADPGLPALLERLHPRVAVIEVGARNPYGHPTAQALGALRAVPRVYRTDREGTVRLAIVRGGMRIATER